MMPATLLQKNAPNSFSAWAVSDTAGGVYSAHSRPLVSGLRGPTSKERRVREGRNGVGEEMGKREGRGEDGDRREGRSNRTTPSINFCVHPWRDNLALVKETRKTHKPYMYRVNHKRTRLKSSYSSCM